MLEHKEFGRLEDEALEGVAGGRGYESNEYENAGVIIVGSDYYAKYSNGQRVKINKTIANSMVDCYRLNGQKLNDEQLKALIEQCG